MNVGAVAVLLSVSGLFLSGCSPASRASAAMSPSVVTPSGIIRSQSDLQRYLAVTAKSGSPLNALSSRARDRFISGLTFNAKGVTGFHYGDLQSELTASQIYNVLRLFGLEKDVQIIPNVRVETTADRRVISSLVDPEDSTGDGSDYKGYYCVQRATCAPNKDTICTSNC